MLFKLVEILSYQHTYSCHVDRGARCAESILGEALCLSAQSRLQSPVAMMKRW